MTKPLQPSFTDYLNKFKQLIHIYCDMNTPVWMVEDVVDCYLMGFTLEECLEHIHERHDLIHYFRPGEE